MTVPTTTTVLFAFLASLGATCDVILEMETGGPRRVSYSSPDLAHEGAVDSLTVDT